MQRKRRRLVYRKERCLLSDVLPYELPITFTNRYFHDFLCNYKIEYSEGKVSWEDGGRAFEKVICLLFGIPLGTQIKRSNRHQGRNTVGVCEVSLEKNRFRVPFRYKIGHKESEFRDLSVPHPLSQLEIVDFYHVYKELMLYYCKVSAFSIRRPERVARFVYFKDKLHYDRLDNSLAFVEHVDFEYENLKSFFVYKDYSNVYRFYDSHKYHRCEKKYSALLKLDVSKCFDSVYTHSIAWAIYGKEFVKENLGRDRIDSTFPGKFDKLMQCLNYNETNGIIIGPELSRIFAEIILQRIDRNIQSELDNLHCLNHRADYEIFRYVDDFFIFYNEDSQRRLIEGVVKHSLKEFGFHVNEQKVLLYDKPIITEITRAKGRIVELFDETLNYKLAESVGADGTTSYAGSIWVDARSLIVRYKCIVKECGVSYRDLLNYTLAVVEAKIETIFKKYRRAHPDKRSTEGLVNALIAILEFAFFIYSVSPRTSPTIKLCRILRIICIFSKSNSVSNRDRHRLLKFVFDDLRAILRKNKSVKYVQVETLYLLIAIAQLGKDYSLDVDDLASYFQISVCKDSGEYKSAFKLNYFSLITIVFYMGAKVRYDGLRNHIEEVIIQRFASYRNNVGKEAELVFLLFDVLACPYLSDALKHRVLEHCGVNSQVDRQMVIDFKARRFKKQQWFTSWFNFNYGLELDYKKGLEVY